MELPAGWRRMVKTDCRGDGGGGHVHQNQVGGDGVAVGEVGVSLTQDWVSLTQDCPFLSLRGTVIVGRRFCHRGTERPRSLEPPNRLNCPLNVWNVLRTSIHSWLPGPPQDGPPQDCPFLSAGRETSTTDSAAMELPAGWRRMVKTDCRGDGGGGHVHQNQVGGDGVAVGEVGVSLTQDCPFLSLRKTVPFCRFVAQDCPFLSFVGPASSCRFVGPGRSMA